MAGMGHGASRMVDPVLHAMGVDPNTLTPGDKMRLIGGLLMTGGGVATGHPLLAAAGIPVAGSGFLRRYLSEPERPGFGPRSEVDYQLGQSYNRGQPS
jgi:hypothetical protein